ncbi:MAG TPA: gliding motility-associated C-terminal domain-containing protein, partial [Bacteroidia bacterium]|nr:gliding motility-associated C-terminal domain-containing protein [Bacteroidia bacterium]
AYLKVTASGGTTPYAYSWSTNPVITSDSIYNLTPGNYSVTVSDANLCSKTFTESIYLNFQTFETVNVFTPNGDTKNEVFFPFVYGNSSIATLAASIDNYELYIYDRWGKKVFYSAQTTTTWDGKETNGSPCPDGVYYWVVSINSKCQNVNTQTFKGFVHLDR